jgi:hypothetical protein
MRSGVCNWWHLQLAHLLEGRLEEGLAKRGQTREHALLAYVMGVRHVVVTVTQLDKLPLPFSKQRFEECKVEAARYLKRVGFVPDRITCVPVSGLLGDNLLEASPSMPWCRSAQNACTVDCICNGTAPCEANSTIPCCLATCTRLRSTHCATQQPAQARAAPSGTLGQRSWKHWSI